MEGYGSYFKNLRVIFTTFHVTIVDAEIWRFFDFVRKKLQCYHWYCINKKAVMNGKNRRDSLSII
jgi:hypothetical protein